MRSSWSLVLLLGSLGCARLLGFEDGYELRSTDAAAGEPSGAGTSSRAGDDGLGGSGSALGGSAGAVAGKSGTTGGASATSGAPTGGSNHAGSSGTGGAPASQLVLEQVAAGDSHACGIRSSGDLVCWGGFYSETIVAPSGSFSAVACGAEASCALDPDGYATCWGAFLDTLAEPPNVPFSSIAVGSGAACGVRASDHGLTCWGPQAPATVPSGTFTHVALGQDFGCALTTAGAIACWQSDLGAEPAGKFSALAAGAKHACALSDTLGTLSCWGANESGQAQPLTGAFASVATGGSTSCGLKRNGTIACWGYDRGTPPVGAFTQLSLGSDFGCALDKLGHIQCWGDTTYGGDRPPER